MQDNIINIVQINKPQKFRKANSVISVYPDFTEIVKYNCEFDIREGERPKFVDIDSGELIEDSINRSRKFVKNSEGILIPNREDSLVSDLLCTVRHSIKRSLDLFYGYALSNDWDYFLTFTINNFYDRFNSELVKSLWTQFLHNFTRRKGFEDSKVLCVPEPHESGALHFHFLLGECNIDKYLVRAYNQQPFLIDINTKQPKLDEFGNKIPNKYYLEPLYSKYGEPIYNFMLDEKGTQKLWNNGFVTVVKLPKDYNRLRVVNYLIGYTTKETNVGYNQKAFFHTQNLNYKVKTCEMLTDSDIDNLVFECMDTNKDIQVFKQKEKFTVYRLYNKKAVEQIKLDV